MFYQFIEQTYHLSLFENLIEIKEEEGFLHQMTVL